MKIKKLHVSLHPSHYTRHCALSLPIACGRYYFRAICTTVNEEGLLCFPTVTSKVTQGVIICDVETDKGSLPYTHSNTHPNIYARPYGPWCTNLWLSLCLWSAFVCMCVSVCLLSYGWVPLQSHWLSEYSWHVGTVHNTVCPCRLLPSLPVPSDLDRGQSSRPSKQCTARPWKNHISSSMYSSYITRGTTVVVSVAGTGEMQYAGTIKIIKDDI